MSNDPIHEFLEAQKQAMPNPRGLIELVDYLGGTGEDQGAPLPVEMLRKRRFDGE